MEQNAGKIINVSSQAGVVALEVHGAYCASKGGLNMLTKVMAFEWGPHNIQVNAVCPTVILTPMGTKVWGTRPRPTRCWRRFPGPLWQAGRGGRPDSVPGIVCVGPDHRRGDPDRRRLHGDLTINQRNNR